MPIKVAQEDREAAAGYFRDISDDLRAKACLSGDYDASVAVQAFTRHRIEAQRPLLEALEIISREAELADVLGYGWKKARETALSAIKQAKGE